MLRNVRILSFEANEESLDTMNKPRLLIVDDDPRYLELLKFTFDGSGIEVVSISDPQEVLAKAISEKPDLIISDISMPELDGFSLALALRANPATSAIPLMFLTARGQHMDRYEGHLVGAVEYLTKPFSPVDLVETVERLLTVVSPGETD